MKTRIFLLSIFNIMLCLFALKPMYAVSWDIPPEQIQEAIEYGQQNKTTDMAAFSKPWSVSLGKGKGAAAIFTPYHNIAYKARKLAVERREFTNKDLTDALQIADSLTFSVTVYGDTDDFIKYYSAKLIQKDCVVQPNFEFVPDIAEASEFWPDSPCNAARLVFKFPVSGIDMNASIALVILVPGGEEILFPFDLAKMK